MTIPSHLSAILKQRLAEPPRPRTEPVVRKEPIKQVFLGKSALTSDPERSLVSARWDANARLVLQFDDGQKITTDPAPIAENIEQHIGVMAQFDNIPYIQFDTAAAIPSAVGQLAWNNTDGTLDLGMKGGNVTLQIGQEQLTHVYNNTADDFVDMQVLRITGSQGQRLTGALAQANTEATSSTTYAVATEHILKNQTGFATTSGLVRDVDTSAFAEGAALYLSPTVAGAITSTKPTAPDHTVMIGWCVRSHAVNGSIYVHVHNGYELDELHNVKITSVDNAQTLLYDAATAVWKNKSTSYFVKTDTTAGVPLTITHNLALVDKDAFTINVLSGGSSVAFTATSTNTNSLTITTTGSLAVSVTVIGIPA